ncbi:MAG: hypothetical protein EOP02_06440 [Proteobacteria bacterium]|nr:MAG: hypothetical protein EOP02_06440 [Pseudomonadota bacterium]
MTPVLRLSLPITLWLVGFSTIYGLQGLSCSRHWPVEVEPKATLSAAFVLFVAVQVTALLLLLRRPDRSRFIQRVAVSIASVALGAAIWTSMPVLALTVCS